MPDRDTLINRGMDLGESLDERAQRLLVQYGLSERESAVYLHLLAHGQLSAGEIAKGIDVRRMEAYRVTKKLAESGLVVAAPGNPVRYTAEPIEEVVAKMMDLQMKKLEAMEKDRAEVVTLGKSIPGAGAAVTEYRFKMVQGREQIYNQVQRMVDAAQESLFMVLTKNDLVQLYILGASEKLRAVQKRGVKTRVMSVIDYQSIEAVEAIRKVAEVRHSDDFASGRVVLADGSQALVSLVLDEDQGRKSERDVAIWTDSQAYARVMAPMLTKAFSEGVEARERLERLRLGRKGEERTRALVDVIRATLAIDGWKVASPGREKGVSGREYEFPVVMSKDGASIAVEIVIASSEEDAREPIIAGIMKGVDVKSSRVVVVASPYAGDELPKLARLTGTALIDGGDVVAAVARLRKEAHS